MPRRPSHKTGRPGPPHTVILAVREALSRGESWEEIGQRLGVSPATVRRYKLGRPAKAYRPKK